MAAIRRAGPGVSVDEMAVEAGVSKPVLYAEFGGKAGIAEAIAVELADQGQQTVMAAMAEAGGFDLATGLRAAIDGLISVVTDEPAVFEFLVRCIRASDQGLLDNALVRTLRAHVAKVIELVAPDRDPALMAALTDGTFGFVFTAVESWQTSRKPSRRELVDALATAIVHGLAAVPPFSLEADA
jgi:AcrR family transcriptional regulator